MSKSSLERLHDLIRTAQISMERGSNAPAVADTVIRTLRRFIVSDDAVHDYALKYGLLGIIQRMIKRKGINPASEHRLADWPEQVRTLVSDIADIAVYDPSSGEYVDLSPDMSPEQIEDSARAIMSHGEDCLRKGRLMLRLATELRESRP